MVPNLTENTIAAVRPVEHLTARQIQAVLDAFAQSGELRRGPFRLYKGVFANPLDMFRVPPGVIVVAVYDGDYERPELLDKGPYHPRAFPIVQQVDLYAVNVRERMYSIPATQEFTLPYRSTADAPVTPIGAKLGITIDYQVELPELVALKLQDPIAALHQAVIDEACYTIVPLRIEELLNTVKVKTAITHGLESASFAQETGIRILHAHVTSLWLDPEIIRALRAKFLATKEAESEAEKQKILHEEWLRQEEEASRRLGIRAVLTGEQITQIIIKQIETSAISPHDLIKVMGGLTTPALIQEKTEPQHLQLNSLDFKNKCPTLDLLQLERDLLASQGITVTVTGMAENYQVVAAFRTPQGQSLILLAECSERYPVEPPTLNLMMNQQPITSPVTWQANSTFLTFVQGLRSAFS